MWTFTKLGRCGRAPEYSPGFDLTEHLWDYLGDQRQSRVATLPTNITWGTREPQTNLDAGKACQTPKQWWFSFVGATLLIIYIYFFMSWEGVVVAGTAILSAVPPCWHTFGLCQVEYWYVMN